VKILISIAKPVSWLSLLLIAVPPILFFTEMMTQAFMNQLMLAGTIIWFASASLWVKSE